MVNEKLIEKIKERLQVGRQKYGHENVLFDDRDFLKESLEEALDCCVYLAASLLEISENEKINSWYKANTTASIMDVR